MPHKNEKKISEIWQKAYGSLSNAKTIDLEDLTTKVSSTAINFFINSSAYLKCRESYFSKMPPNSECLL